MNILFEAFLLLGPHFSSVSLFHIFVNLENSSDNAKRGLTLDENALNRAREDDETDALGSSHCEAARFILP